MKKEIITICGSLGSGKSSTADRVAETLGYKRFSSGDFFRQVAVELGQSVTELNKRAETDSSIDIMTDDKIRALNNSEKIVIDSRTAFHWIPESFKVYLDLPPEIAKDRILASFEANKLRRASEGATDAESIYRKMQERFQSEQKRYWDLYKIDNTDKSQYDLVIDTNKNNLEQVVSEVVEKYREWLKN
ncbi:MAG TPA: cytidylate kinase family protein [Candidatus Paceibacterota bacterium]|nr:cytidylate kinase family protein [Candidatus Paceibacterota bacterium]